MAFKAVIYRSSSKRSFPCHGHRCAYFSSGVFASSSFDITQIVPFSSLLSVTVHYSFTQASVLKPSPLRSTG